MKTLINIPIIILALLFSFNAFSQQIPFLNEDVVNTSHFYFPNNGQIADNEGTLHPEVLFHTEFTSPKYFFQENKISFVSLIVDSLNPDTVFRIDMEFYQPPASINGIESVPNLVAQNQRTVKMNYYLPHCGNGIELVPSYERLIYENAYDDIDVEVTSNASGLKARFIVHPGGNPNDILLKFTGQDSVLPQISGDLKLYLQQWDMDLRQAYAYQIDANNQPYLLTWLPVWNHNGNGIVSVTTYSYDPAQPLIIELAGPGSAAAAPPSSTPPHWSTYYGGEDIDRNTDFTTDNYGNLYTLTNTKSGSTFPMNVAVTLPTNTFYNILVSKFKSNDEQEYASFFGGTNDVFGLAIEHQFVPDGVGKIFVGGYTQSTGLERNPTNSSFNQTKKQGTDGIIIEFRAGNLVVDWASYYGGDGDDKIYDIKSNGNNELYFCGITNSIDDGINDGIPLTNPGNNGFYQTNVNSASNPNPSAIQNDGFIFQLTNTATASPAISMNWSTYFGGAGLDHTTAIEVTTSPIPGDFYHVDAVYVVGYTNSNITNGIIGSPASANNAGFFPLANLGGNSYFQYLLGSQAGSIKQDAFISKFNGNKQLVWSTLFGGNESDLFSGVAINSNGVFAVGYTESTTGNCATNIVGKIPKCSTTSNGYTHSLNGDRDLLITQFSTSGNLLWSTCYGSNGHQSTFGTTKCVSDAFGNVYITGNSKPNQSSPSQVSTLSFNGQYYDASYSSNGQDNILLMFNDDYKRLWATYFGGGCPGCAADQGDELVRALTISDNSEWLYFGGETRSLLTPTHDPSPAITEYFDDTQGEINSTLARVNDGYITKMNIQNLATFLEELTNNGTIGYLKGYPNPTTNIVNVILPTKESVQTQVLIYTNVGQLIKTADIVSSSDVLTLDVSFLNTGLYFLKINTKTNNYVYSFVKQ